MKNKKTHIWIALGIIAVFLFIAFFGCGSDIKGIRDMRFGIDIKGGVEAVFEPVGITKKPTPQELEAARNIMEGRLDAKNILDREVTVEKQEGRILVRFPWKSDEKDFDPQQAIAELGETAKLTFRDENNKVLVEGQDVSSSSVVQSRDTRAYEVELHFNKNGTEKFAKATQDNLGKNIGIYMDDTLISNPVVQQKIEGGEAVINGMASRDEAQALSDKINAGALPFSMKTSNYNTISPTLGGRALTSMVAAAVTAMVLVCLFMSFYYRLPGILSCITLLFQMSLQVLAISVPQYTITLPGIAGLILSAGMAVDANIIISERISEELMHGLSVKAAVKKGYQRAFSSVLDGNLTTAAVAVILMIFGSGTMLSFGYTLLTGVVINLFAGVWMSRTMLTSVVQYEFFKRPSMFRRKKEKKILDFSGKRKWIFLFTACVLLTGTILSSVNGMKLDTQFTGGVILKYTCSGKADTEKLREDVEAVLDRPANRGPGKQAAETGGDFGRQQGDFTRGAAGSDKSTERGGGTGIQAVGDLRGGALYWGKGIEKFHHCHCTFRPVYCHIYKDTVFRYVRACSGYHSSCGTSARHSHCGVCVRRVQDSGERCLCGSDADHYRLFHQ